MAEVKTKMPAGAPMRMGTSSVIRPMTKTNRKEERISGRSTGRVTRRSVPMTVLPQAMDCSSSDGSMSRKAFMAMRNTMGDS